jgi:hypothetical protein
MNLPESSNEIAVAFPRELLPRTQIDALIVIVLRKKWRSLS